MKKIRVSIILLLFAASIFAQEKNIVQFAVWKPKEGQLQNFENGYKQHLNWHKINADKWSWYGWFVVSGIRYGQFVDATFDHAWADFDKAVKPADDMADNRVHVFPFAEVQTVFKASYYPQYSTADTFANKLKLVKFLTINVDNIENGLMVIDKLKDFYVTKKIKSFKTYKVVDGGLINQIIIMMGFSSWEEYGLCENIDEKVSEFEQNLKVKSFQSISSETMVYRTDMSWFPN
jgi:hypothetical protein